MAYRGLILAVVGILVATVARADQGGTRVLTVLATNDLHGALGGVQEVELAGKARWLGGLEYLAGLIEKLRAEAKGPSILLDAGDCFQGELAVNQSEGMICVRMFELMKYDAVTIGNHEFDYLSCGPDEIALERGPKGFRAKVPDDPRCALRKAVGEARYPVVLANCRDAVTKGRGPVPGVRPYVVKDVQGIKVGITGVVTRSTPMVSNPGGTVGLVFTDPVKEIRDVLPKMRAEGAQVVVVLAHLNGECRGNKGFPSNGETACVLTGELGKLANAFRPGEVDLIVAGHSHVYLAGAKTAIPVMEAVAQGRFVARAELTLDSRTGKVKTRVLPAAPVCRAEDADSRVCSRSFPGFVGVAEPDQAALALREEAMGRAQCGQVVATLKNDILNGRGTESPLANLAADMMREAATEEAGAKGPGPADFAFINLGATRDSLMAGPVTVCDLYRVWPFEDRLAELDLTGAELLRLLGFVTGKLNKSLAISGGTLLTGRGGVELLGTSGNPVKPDRTYRVVTTLYLLRGGDRVNEALGDLPAERLRLLSYPTYRDAFRAVMERRKELESPDTGRVRRR